MTNADGTAVTGREQRILDIIETARSKRPRFKDAQITMAHGAGGKATQTLIEGLLVPAFGSAALEGLPDAGVVTIEGTDVALTTDSFVVKPIRFPGGSIGELAVNGTVNDLAVSGARPLALSLSLVLEEGLAADELRAEVEAIAAAARAAEVEIVAGDTKVVERGHADSMYVCTTGLGRVDPRARLAPTALRPGDRVLLSGPIGAHGTAIMLARGELGLEAAIESDTCSLWPAADALMESAGGSLRCMRDATRGGVASVLNELARASGVAMVVREGDVIAVAGLREVLVQVIGANATEVEDRELLAVPVEGVDVLVTNKEVDGKTLAELAQRPAARGVFLRKITRGATATDIPILPSTKINRGDLFTLVGRTQDVAAATKMLGVADRPTDVTDMAFVGVAIVVGALIGALVFNVAGVPLTLSTAGGALVAGIIGGWLRSVRPYFGRIPTPTVWFMNSVGLNIFIAIVGISAGPGFVGGLKTQGIGLFLWGALATTIPLVLGMFTAKYIFRFHDALTLGIVSGSRTTTASLGLVCDIGKSQVPALGYTVTYAVGNTLLTIWGMVIVMLLS